MTLFQKVCAMLEGMVEEKDLPHGITREQFVAGAAVSDVLERAYGLHLHGKVNQAFLQAMHGRTNFGPFFRASIANDMSVRKNKELENLRIALMESVVIDVCNGWKPAQGGPLNQPWGFTVAPDWKLSS
jgi:hypothetical protein